MTNPAVKTRTEMVKDLGVAGFGEKQSLAIVQAVVDKTAALNLVTRTDLNQAVEDLVQKIEELRRDLQALSRSTDARFKALDQKIDDNLAELRRDLLKYVDDKFNVLDYKIDYKFNILNQKIDDRFNILAQRIVEVQQEIGSLRSLIYRCFIVGMGLLSLLLLVVFR